MEIGAKIYRLRVGHGLTQEELAARCELSKGYISQLERDLTSPSIATLCDILECLGTTPSEFFSESGGEKVVFRKDDLFTTEYESGATVQWLVPNSQKNDMEPIMVTINPGGSTEEDEPHSGEEYGYVLQGTVQLHLGSRKIAVHKGDSFYYSPDETHYITNESKRPAQLLWISTPPSF